MPQVISIPKWTRVKRADHPIAKKVVDVAFALGVSLCCVDYLAEEDMRSYELALINEDNVSPLRASPGSNEVRPSAAKVVSSVSPAKAIPPAVVPSSSVVVPL